MTTKKKTRKSVSARFRVTGTGKLRFDRPGRRHLLCKKSGKRKRQLERPGLLTNQKMVRTYRRMLGL